MLPAKTVMQRFAIAFGIVLLAPCASVAASRFTDVPGDYWAKRYIETLGERGIISGYADGSFQPNRPVTRSEFAVILAKSQGLNTTAQPQHSESFRDIPESFWAAPAIQAVVKQGWMAGYPGDRFRPNQILTMGEMYAIVSKAESRKESLTAEKANDILSHYRDADELAGWARIPVASAIASGITVTERSHTRLAPDLPAVRASVATSIAKLVNPALRDYPEASAPQKEQSENTPSGQPQAEASNPALAEAMSQCPAVNLVGVLEAPENASQWALVRADGKRYRLNATSKEATQWHTGQQVRVTGNLDAMNASASDPIVTVQTISPIEPYQGETIPAKPTQAASPVEETTSQPEQESEQQMEPEKAETTVPLYFPNLSNLVSDPALMLGEPVQRSAKDAGSPKKAVTAILQGPTEAERKQGYFMDQDLKRLSLGKLTIDKEGAASVIIKAPGDFQFSNTSVPARLSEQIRRTLKQFEGIRTVRISVQNPKNKAIWISP